MNEDLLNCADTCYKMAEQKAAHYFKSLYMQVMQRAYVPALTKDIQWWKYNHIHHNSLFRFFLNSNKKPDSREFHNYIKWLDYTGKLDDYLDRSVSYIFMRDLGKDLSMPEVRDRVRRAADSLKKVLIRSAKGEHDDETRNFSMVGLYRKAQKEGIEPTLVWLINKLQTVSANIPKGVDAEQAQRKLIKLIGGVMMHEIEEMSEEILPEERARRLDKAMRLGYSYGLTYPFIDDLLDADVLSPEEKSKYSDLIRTTLVTGTVPELGEWTGNNTDLIRYVHSELKDAFEYIKANQLPGTMKSFLDQSYVFFNSQEIDRVKELSNAGYTNEELYIPVILKSSSSRLIVRSIIGAPEDEGFDNRTFYYGIYNQLADDFTDMSDDFENGKLTPYTYYIKYHDKRTDLINPFELYWTVISNLIHNVYRSDTKACEVILDRAINSLKRFKERVGIKRYDEVMGLFASGDPQFNSLIQDMVRNADDVDFFDKLLRDHIITTLKNEREEQEYFLDTIEDVRSQINSMLKLSKAAGNFLMEGPIIDAANYSLGVGGKRLRPITTWVMGIDVYGLERSAVMPLLKSLEYMHTASLIFDDLPSQDNASARRGSPTLHQVYNAAIAELTGLFLVQKAVEEQASLYMFDPKTVLALIRYSAQTVQSVCMGQAMDLDSRGKQLTLEQLKMLCFYKTGIAFEASLIMPAILARVNDLEMEALRGFAYHAGIAFQIKDDLLDVEGDPCLLGKTVGQDDKNKNSTFVSVLGQEGARKEMWEHYCLAAEALQSVPRKITFLKHLLGYIVSRDH